MIYRIVLMEKRERIFEYILEKEEFGVEEVSGVLGISKGLVLFYFKEFFGFGLLEKKGRKFFLKFGVEFREMKRFFNFWMFRDKIFLLREEWMFVFGVYGSFVCGENGFESDFDIWVLVEKNDLFRIMEFKEEFEIVIEREIDFFVFMREKLVCLKEENLYLYWGIKFFFFVLWGEFGEV